MDGQNFSFGDISASSLVHQLDAEGVVRLPSALSKESLEALRISVTDFIVGHGDGDFFISQDEIKTGSPAHRLAFDSTLHQLFSEVARLGCPKPGLDENMRCAIPVRPGTAPKMRSKLFHYDASILTMIVPIFIPEGAIGSNGELAAFRNKRPFRRFVASNLVEKVLTHNSLYRRRITEMVLADPEKYVVNLRPGDAYVFWGYRTFHGNLDCAPGALRATLVLQFGEVHSGSRALNVAWKFSRSRRDFGRFQYLPELPADSAHRV